MKPISVILISVISQVVAKRGSIQTQLYAFLTIFVTDSPYNNIKFSWELFTLREFFIK
ncbi:hypothetical protein PAQ31011_02141 [Pandoraea aquatica]|uniref:Uncharacterized protein n=1 Tax=Pandoraea aquatica TaxID=2508290 RepID=A0A5E4UM46_9BURK|nr:hypothetical protein PAQ31011_02141 [Pandoraea aquatica]